MGKILIYLLHKSNQTLQECWQIASAKMGCPKLKVHANS